MIEDNSSACHNQLFFSGQIANMGGVKPLMEKWLLLWQLLPTAGRCEYNRRILVPFSLDGEFDTDPFVRYRL